VTRFQHPLHHRRGKFGFSTVATGRLVDLCESSLFRAAGHAASNPNEVRVPPFFDVADASRSLHAKCESATPFPPRKHLALTTPTSVFPNVASSLIDRFPDAHSAFARGWFTSTTRL
jgi:hypothetical protein